MGLWNYLKDRKGTLLDWNEDGEVSVHGQGITGSHMIDLVKHAVTPLSKKRPLGYSQFYSVLGEMHIPTEFLVQHDSNTQNDIQDNQSGSGKKRTSWTETKTNSMDFVFVLSRTKYRNEYNLLQYLI